MEAYRARWLLPILGDPIEDGVLAVEHGSIVKIGRADDLQVKPCRDLGECILLPGFVNAHTHLELSCYRGRVRAAPLWQWFEQLMALRSLPGAADAERAAIRTGAEESLEAGVTCVGDISRTGAQMDALRSSPIRKVCFVELISGAGARPNDAASLMSMFDAGSSSAIPLRHVIGISPHALYTVTWQDLREVAAFAAERRAPVTVHLLESAEEAEWLPTGAGLLQTFLDRYRLPTTTDAGHGSAFDILRRAGFAPLCPLLAHVNYIDDEGLQDLAASHSSVVWCPRSHRFFGHAPHRWREMLEAGVNVCIGTDSLASNETLSILDELRTVRALTPEVAPNVILEMGTSRGADGLGLAHQLGSLAVGHRADFITIPWDPAGPMDPAQNLLDSSRQVDGVWIDGEELWARG